MSEAGRLQPPEGMSPLGPPAWPPPPPPAPPRKSRWWIPVVVVGVVAIAVGAVIAVAQLANDDSDERADDRPARSTTIPEERSPRTTAEVPSRTAPPTADDGVAYDDPQGKYTITLGQDWEVLPSTMVAEIETWAVGDRASGFTPNVNVLAQEVPGMGRDEYMRISVEGLDSIDGEVVDQAFVTGPNGNTLGLIEYTARPPGVRVDLHFVAVFDLRDGTAVVGTFTAVPDQFDELRAAVEPYLLTLQAAA